MSREEHEAARWLMCSAEERETSPEFARWIARPGNRALFDQMAVLLDLLPQDEALGAMPLPGARRVSRRALIGGGIGLAAVMGGLGIATSDRGVLQTGRDERLTADLPEGEILLDAGSRLSQREGAPLELLDGRAEIRSAATVALVLPGCRVQARGRVSLHRAGPGSEITVIEGSCTVIPDLGPPFDFGVGDQALIVPGEPARKRSVDLTEVLAWTEGRAVFEDRPLWLVIADLNRYRRGQVRLMGALAARRVSGGYPISDPEQGLDGLVAGLGLRRRDVTPWLVLLSA